MDDFCWCQPLLPNEVLYFTSFHTSNLQATGHCAYVGLKQHHCCPLQHLFKDTIHPFIFSNSYSLDGHGSRVLRHLFHVGSYQNCLVGLCEFPNVIKWEKKGVIRPSHFWSTLPPLAWLEYSCLVVLFRHILITYPKNRNCGASNAERQQLNWKRFLGFQSVLSDVSPHFLQRNPISFASIWNYTLSPSMTKGEHKQGNIRFGTFLCWHLKFYRLIQPVAFHYSWIQSWDT